MTFSKTLSKLDPELASAIELEQKRQEEHIELIASENYASNEVMEIQGSVLTNKYAEGYPGRRYYGGCKHVDEAELLAIERVKQLFDADYANVQPHSGSQANMAVYMSLLDHGDKILGMSLSDGGHLTHGAKVNFSGQISGPIFDMYGEESRVLWKISISNCFGSEITFQFVTRVCTVRQLLGSCVDRNPSRNLQSWGQDCAVRA